MEQQKKARSRFRREKFKGFRRMMLAACLIFLLFFMGEIFLLGAWGVRGALSPVGAISFFRRLVFWEILFYLTSFFLGVTVYAPAVLFLLAAVRGGMTGFLLCVTATLEEGVAGVLLTALFGLWLFLSAWIFLSYGSFCAMVSLRLFSTGVLRDPKKEEERLFGGVLFNSSLYRGTVNLRFMGTYLLFFIGFLLLSGLLDLGYAFLRSLFS